MSKKPKSPILHPPPGFPVSAFRVPLLTLLLLTFGYLAAYYLAQPLRLEYWRTLILPDVVWADWTGGTGVPALFDRLPVWMVVAWYLMATYAAGSLALRVLRLEGLSPLERFVFAASVGLSLWSTFTLLIGLVGGLHAAWLFRLVAIVLPLTEIAFQFRAPSSALRAGSGAERGARNAERKKEGSDVSSSVPGSPFPVPRLLSLALLFFTALYLLAGTTPPTDFDVREYHLQVPKEWFQAGRVDFLPHNVYGNMPHGAEMHALACMELWLGSDAWWYGALAGKAVIALFGPLTALGLIAAGQRFYSETAGFIAAFVYLSFPWIAHVSFHGLVDGVLAHYTLVAIYAAMIAGTDWRKQLLAGLLAGSAAACKYPGVVFVAGPVGVLVIVGVIGLGRGNAGQIIDRQRRIKALGLAVGCVLVGGIVGGGLWYAKNAVLTGNPVYPLAATLLDGKTRTPDKIAQWNRAHQVPRDADGNRYSFAQFLAAKKQVGLTSEWLSPIAWPLAVVGVLATWRRRGTRILLSAVAWIFAVWFFATHRIDRFWLPAVPLLALLSGAAWHWSATTLYRRTLVGLTGLGILAATLMLIAPIVVNERPHPISNPYWLVSLERLRAEQIAPSHQQLQEIAKPDEALLLVGDAEPFDLNMPAYYNTCFDDSVFELLTKDRSPEDILVAFRQRKIAYVLVDWREIQRYRSPGNYGFTDYVQPEVFARLVQQGVLGPARWSEKVEGQASWGIYPVVPTSP
jgi:hypothetical protein